MTNESWYAVVDAACALTQGDFIFDCPLMGWKAETVDFDGQDEEAVLKAAIQANEADVIVLTQACDLEQDRVANVILCPHLALSAFREAWESRLKEQDQYPSTTGKLEKAWANTCKDIRDGFVWNHAMLNHRLESPLSIEHRVVDFREVYTVPRSFLESFLHERGGQRLRLLPPYREHLSQAFARFFMRVGLPTPVAAIWQS
ncbi:MAG: hypothetical protein ABIG44_15015 [Planctomycetota bacterium]